MKFRDVLEAYRNLLVANPGKALLTTGGNVAYLEDGELFGAALKLDGTPDLESGYDFDANAFLDEGCWDGMTPEETRARITNPTFLDL
jgi:hypothetical protein